MKKDLNQENNSRLTLPESVCEHCGFVNETALEIHAAESTMVVVKQKMTALELVHVIMMLNQLTCDFTTHLAQACGTCNGCGDIAKEDFYTPAERVSACTLCHELLDERQKVHIPRHILADAGIPENARLDAFAEENGGTVIITESETQQDISDVPPGLIKVLAAGGVCLAELDALIMLEETVYGE